MEHSLEAYLGRQSTQILEVALRGYLETEEKLIANTDVVLLILKELEKRWNPSDEEMSENMKQAWERYLEHMKQAGDFE